MKSRLGSISALSAALAVVVGSLGGCWADADTPVFTLTSPDLVTGTFATGFILNGFGCTGGNVSPELRWANVPSGTKSLALQMYDPDAPSGSGFWHWAVYDIPPDTTGLARGVGNNARLLPAGAFGGNTDFLDTGATGVNGVVFSTLRTATVAFRSGLVPLFFVLEYSILELEAASSGTLSLRPNLCGGDFNLLASAFCFEITEVNWLFFLTTGLPFPAGFFRTSFRIGFFLGFGFREGMTDAFKGHESCEDKCDEIFATTARDSYNLTPCPTCFLLCVSERRKSKNPRRPPKKTLRRLLPERLA